MTAVVHDHRPVLSRPGRFLAAAGRDLRRSLPIAWTIYRSKSRSRHRQTLLGYLWLLLPTLSAAGVFLFIQSRRIVVIGPTELPYAIFVLAGMVLWQVFAEAMAMPLQQLKSSRQIMTRSAIPHEALVLAGVGDVLTNAAVRMAVLVVALVLAGVPLHSTIALVPIGVAALALMGLTIGLMLTPLGMLYEDVGHGLTVVANCWFFLTPVVYPTPEYWLFRLNPVTPLLTTTRTWLHAPADAAVAVFVTFGFSLALVCVWLCYRIARPHIVARLG